MFSKIRQMKYKPSPFNLTTVFLLVVGINAIFYTIDEEGWNIVFGVVLIVIGSFILLFDLMIQSLIKSNYKKLVIIELSSLIAIFIVYYILLYK